MAPRDFPDWFGCYATPAPPLSDVLAGPQTPKSKRVRRPTLASQAAQLWRAAHAAGLNVVVAIEAGKVTATPVAGTDAVGGEINEWDRDLGTNTAQIRQ